MARTSSWSPRAAATPRCIYSRPRGSTPEVAMPERIRGVRLMLGISLPADAARSVAALVTASGQMIAMPLRAVGLQVLVDGMASHDHRRAALGAVLIAGISALGRFVTWAS